MTSMDDFDLSIDGFAPDDRNNGADTPYRPYEGGMRPRAPYTNPFGEEPYRPPVPTPEEKPRATQQNAQKQASTVTAEKTPPRPAQKPKQCADPPQEMDYEPYEGNSRGEAPRRAPIKKDKKRREGPLPIVKFFKSERFHIFLALTLVVLSIYMVISLTSHFMVGGNDQSAIDNLTMTELAKQPALVENAGGNFGALMSRILMCDSFGLGSVVLIVYMWLLALSLLKVRKCNFWGTTFRCALLTVTISIVLALATFDVASEVYWGGNHGRYVNEFLIANTDYVGAILVSLLLVATVCCVYINELRILWHRYQASAQRRRLREELRRERQRELEQREEEWRLSTEPGHSDNPLSESHHAAEPKQPKRTIADSIKSIAGKIHPHKNDEGACATGTAPVTPPSRTSDLSIDNFTIPVGAPAAATTVTAAPSATSPADDAVDDELSLIIDPDNMPEVAPTKPRDDGKFSIVAPQIEEAGPEEANIPMKAPSDLGLFDHRAELSRYNPPTVELLEERPSGPTIDMTEQQANKERIEKTLLEYKIPISRIEATVGPTVTLYEIVPAEGIRISSIKRLEDDIALSLSALGIRIIAPIPGKGTVGIEVPNNDPKTVSIRSVLNSKKFRECKMALPMAMGATISNEIFIADLAKMPHLLVAGATGMGKSVGLNTIIASLLYKKHPSELKFVLIDPKMVEFSLYSRLERHFLAKLPNEDDAIITDMKKVIETLNSLCVEMEDRYKLLRDANVRSLEEYNRKFTERHLNPEKGHRYLPYIVVVVDEFADLIMTQGKEIETPISRIAQKARAVGIHMILATQRPSTNVITGLIKANFPGRIAFRVIQMVDSRTILDCPGANQLIGRGDMLFSHNGIMERVQCAFISTEEVEAITEFIDNQIGYEHAYYLPEYVPEEAEGGVIAGASTERDALFDEAARFVVSRQMGSTSSLQRQFGIGYNRAGKLMDQMEGAGIVGQVNGSKPRSILVDMTTLETILGQN